MPINLFCYFNIPARSPTGYLRYTGLSRGDALAVFSPWFEVLLESRGP
jgi:hypothetical protein